MCTNRRLACPTTATVVTCFTTCVCPSYTIVDLDHGNCVKPLDLSSMQVVLWQTACVSLRSRSRPKRVAQYRVKTGTSWPSPKAAYFLPPQVGQMLFYVEVQHTMDTMHACCLHSCNQVLPRETKLRS